MRIVGRTSELVGRTHARDNKIRIPELLLYMPPTRPPHPGSTIDLTSHVPPAAATRSTQPTANGVSARRNIDPVTSERVSGSTVSHVGTRLRVNVRYVC